MEVGHQKIRYFEIIRRGYKNIRFAIKRLYFAIFVN